MSDAIRPVAPSAVSPPELERQSAPRKPATPREEGLPAAIEQLRESPAKVRFGAGAAEFSYDPEVDRVIVRIYSSTTEPREMVRQFPPEDYLTFAARYRELLGLLFDEEA